MHRAALTPVFVGLRAGLHALVVALTLLVVVHAIIEPSESGWLAIGLAVVFLGTYAVGARWLRGLPWFALLCLEWVALLALSSQAAYLVFPLFFLALHVLGRRIGPLAVVALTAVAIVALGLHGGWSIGGIVGPLVGAGIALLIGLGYDALAREAREREALMVELVAARDQLAATERESGVLAERSRLAREIHDTLAQGLSSIQMLLHAAELADPERPGIEHIRLARETAADNLAEARRFIRELTPPGLDGGLGGALRRLAATQWAAQGLTVEVRVGDTAGLPMSVQTALLRIAQGAIANVVQHADATTASIALDLADDTLIFTVTDDGRGFDADAVGDTHDGHSDSFGLHATRERVQQLGGTLTVDSAAGRGTRIAVELAGAHL